MENENDVKVYFGIIMTALAFIIIAGGFIIAAIRYQKRLLFKQQELLKLDAQHKQELLLISIQSAETERMQLAKDMHDEIGSIFSTLSLSINRLKDELQLPEETIADSKKLVQSGIDSVRRISHAIVPFELELLGLQETLDNHFESISSISGIHIVFKNNANLKQLNKMTSLAIYRIFQELLSNCIKYAKATTVEIDIIEKDEYLVINYKDNGQGTRLIPTNKGIGLKNIESRVLLMQGDLKFTSQPKAGFECTITLPLIQNTSL
jgi:two-component system, NarL family, sensor kinase